jgi:bifunctional DNase/RNase
MWRFPVATGRCSRDNGGGARVRVRVSVSARCQLDTRACFVRHLLAPGQAGVYVPLMINNVVPVELRNVVAMDSGHAVFLGNEEKTFVILVDEPVGLAISMSMRGIVKDRPLTHDLIGHMLRAFGAKVERVIINALDGGVFYARLILTAENEVQARKVVEIDARPSDSIAMAVANNAPILVAKEVWENVDDVSDTLEQLQKQGRRKREEEQ